MKDNMLILQGFNTAPALIAPQFVNELRHAATQPREPEKEADAPTYAELCAMSMGVYATDPSKPYVFSDGIAVIPVYGALVNKYPYESEYITGYNLIQSKLSAALADPDVKGIVFDVNSYGGHVAGNFELAENIRAARDVKPSIAVVDNAAYSGGYSLGSAAGKLIAGRSAGVGSIGVVAVHASYEKLLQNAGISVTFIYAGKQKIDGNMYQDLPDDVRERFQARVDKSYEQFVSLVAENRDLDPQAVRDTEAACFDADEALAAGLIDAIQSPADAVAAFRLELAGKTTTTTRVSKMSQNNNTKTAPAATQNADAATATQPTAQQPAADASTQPDAASAERARIAGIQTCEEAKGREQLASHLAFNTDMSVDEAKKMLAAAPVATPKANTGNVFEAAMDNSQNPEVGATADKTGDGNTPAENRGDRIARAYASTTGIKLVDTK